MATILTKKKDTSGAPSAGDLTNDTGGAELAVNTADKRLYTKDSGGNVVEVGINPTSITTGTLNTSGQVVFNDAGADVDFRVESDTKTHALFVDGATGVVGVNVEPAAWGSSYQVVQIGEDSGVSNFSTGGYAFVSQNVLFGPSSNTYIKSAPATYYRQFNGTHGFFTAASGTAGNAATFTQAMTLDSSGNVGIGTGTPVVKGQINGSGSSPSVSADNGIFMVSALSSNQTLEFGIATASSPYPCWIQSKDSRNNGNAFAISLNPLGGAVLVGTTSDDSSRLNVVKGDATGPVLRVSASSGSYTGAMIEGYGVRTTTNGTYYLINLLNGNSSGNFRVLDSGNAQNTNNSYGAISDVKLKENIVDASPKLDKLNQVRVVNYNLKSNPDQKLLGVVAQELEQIFHGMVEESPDYITVTKTREVEAVFDDEGNEITPATTEEYTEQEATGTTTKAVKYSVFVPMLIKAIQELSAKNDALEARIAALENA